MSVNQIAIDIGGTYTSIYKKGQGIVLKEPSLVAVSGANGEYNAVCYGDEALLLDGKTGDNMLVFSPISGGELKNIEFCSKMLNHFLRKVEMVGPFKKISAVVAIPVASTEKAKNDYLEMCYGAGIKSVKLVPNIICSALGGGKFVDTPTTYFVVDIGGASSDIATINMNSIIKGCTLGVGGNNMDEDICNLVYDYYQTSISMQTAKDLKQQIGTLYDHDTQNMEVVGIDTETKNPKTTIVVSDIVKEALLPSFEKIALAIEATINMCSPDISIDIARNGIFFSGGVASIVGLEDFMRKRLKLNVQIVDYNEKAAILGTGKLLSENKQLDSIVANF